MLPGNEAMIFPGSFLYLRVVMGNDIFMRLFDVLGAFWCTWRLLDVFGAFWCTWRLFIAYSRQRSQCFGDFYRDFSMKSLFSRFVSVVLAGEGAIRTGNFSSNLCFPGLFRWFHTFTFIIFYKLMFYHILHKLIN